MITAVPSALAVILPEASIDNTELSEVDQLPPLFVCVKVSVLFSQISETPNIAGPICNILLVLPVIFIELIVKSFPLILESEKEEMLVLSDDPVP